MKNEKEKAEYLEFVEKIRRIIETGMKGEEAGLIFQEGSREEEEKDMLILTTKVKNGLYIQRFHVEEIYQDYLEGQSMKDIASCISGMLSKGRKLEDFGPLHQIADYEAVKHSLIIRPKNADRNKKQLEDGIYEQIGDIALVLYVNIGNCREIYASSMVPKKMLEQWNKNQKNVMEEAKQNTLDLFPPRIFNWFDFDKFGHGDYGAFMEPQSKAEITDGAMGTFLTTSNQCNGAAAVFLPGVAKRLGELMGADFYIAFTSMHEVVVHGFGTVEEEDIRDSLKNLNKKMPAEEEFLSEKVYYYSRKDEIIRVL